MVRGVLLRGHAGIDEGNLSVVQQQQQHVSGERVGLCCAGHWVPVVWLFEVN